MKLEVVKGKEDTFTKDDSCFCVDENFKMYDVFESEETYFTGACIGKFRVIVENGNVLEWIYPLLNPPGNFELIRVDNLKKWKKIITSYEKRTGSELVSVD